MNLQKTGKYSSIMEEKTMHQEIFASMLAAARAGTGMTCKISAGKIGVSLDALSKWETRMVLPGEDKIPLIAKEYGVDENYLRLAYNMAKTERKELGKNRRRVMSKKKTPTETTFSGEIESFENLGRMNFGHAFHNRRY